VSRSSVAAIDASNRRINQSIARFLAKVAPGASARLAIDETRDEVHGRRGRAGED
jgi:hypothetical protein